MREELYELLNESDNMENNYNAEDDESMPKEQFKRKKVLKISDIDKLKRIRNKQRKELAQDSVYVPILYGPQENPEGGMGGMGL